VGVRVLLIEDEPGIADFVVRGLREEGFTVEHAPDGPVGLYALRSGPWDVALLDWWLPGLDGLAVLKQYRSDGGTCPVLFLTARDAVSDRVRGLDGGADDYLCKPFAFEELLARVEALARRPRAMASPILRAADLELNRDTREVRRSGEPIELTPKEYAVLEYLMRHQGRVMSRTLITEYAWGYHFDPGTNIVDVVINHLRKKIDAKHDRKLITTVRGVGYVVKG
jgi:two-component system, OmpR family, response regulator